MLLSFTLSMPGVNSWNGKWSGASSLYARVVNFRGKEAEIQAHEILSKGYYHYNFGDGWRAGITVKHVDAKEANRIKRKTSGFCGYDWMIRSIREKGFIEAPSQA